MPLRFNAKPELNLRSSWAAVLGLLFYSINGNADPVGTAILPPTQAGLANTTRGTCYR